ncbi:MAG: hypothetical protein HXX19_02880 [Rhodoferax sp.]|nr:hypothetical protein [Rhodoferax sp.]
MLPNVTVTPAAAKFINRITIDFVETATSSGLSFIDPNKEACACSSADTAPKTGVTKIDISSIGRGRPAPVLAS